MTIETIPGASNDQAPRGRVLSAFLAHAPIIASVTVTVLFVAIIGSLFLPYLFGYQSGSTLLRELASLDQARGLITFLVAVTTVGIALILIVFVTITNDSSVKDKFILGKEVFTGLVGILGTIVGFYFGSASQSGFQPGFKIEAVQVDPSTVRPGEKFKVRVKTSGAKLPIDYSVSFGASPEIPSKASSAQVEDFVEEVVVPKEAKVGSVIDVQVAVKDKNGATASSKQFSAIQVKVGQ